MPNRVKDQRRIDLDKQALKKAREDVQKLLARLDNGERLEHIIEKMNCEARRMNTRRLKSQTREAENKQIDAFEQRCKKRVEKGE